MPKPRHKKQNGGCQGQKGREEWELLFMGAEFQFHKMKNYGDEWQ